MNLYDKVPIDECYKAIGRAPISVRWIDINKGDVDNPNYRRRLMAREINTHKRADIFAATPPLEALKIILSMTTTSNKGELIMINDASRAFSMQKQNGRCMSNLLMKTMRVSKEGYAGA